MKCIHCKKEIINEFESVHIADGDFVCNKECETLYIKERDKFFENIGNDTWYENNYFKLDN